MHGGVLNGGAYGGGICKGERVRDKIAASKRKGIRVGGSIPLGYRSVNKKLQVVPKEAETVRRIFALYVEVGSVGALAAALDEQGVRPKQRQLANGQSKAAERYTVGLVNTVHQDLLDFKRHVGRLVRY